VVERPKPNIDSDRPKSPTRTTGLRPTISESLPQCKTVMVCATKNTEYYTMLCEIGGQINSKTHHYANIKAYTGLITVGDPNITNEL
jgi:hypothetical protein